MARRAHDEDALADVLAACYWATRGPDDPGRHLQMARELTCLAESVGDARLLANGRAWVINHHLEQGDMDAALRETDQLQQLARSRNDRYARWLLAAVQAMHTHIQGQLGRSESFALEAVALWADRPQFASPAQVFTAQTFALRREQGRLDELVELVAAVVDQTPEVPAWRCVLAHLYAHLGDRDHARRELHLLGDLSSLPRDALWLPSITMLATVTSFLHDRNRSREAYELLLPHANTCLVAISLVCEGSTSRPLGMLATTLARYDDAELYFQQALTMNAQIRSPLLIAHTQHDYAHMLLLRNHAGDNHKALQLLTEVLATAEQLGLKMLADKARPLELTARSR
jgi:tetratricopeptide (TPR) repeat protein